MFRLSLGLIRSQSSWQQLHVATRRLPKLTTNSHQNMCSGKNTPGSSVQPAASQAYKSLEESETALPTRKLTTSQKRYILLAFKHKSLAEVPDVLTVTAINQLYTRARITVNLMMGALTLVLCIAAIYVGKRRAASGLTISKINQDWHKQIKEDYLEEQKAAGQQK